MEDDEFIKKLAGKSWRFAGTTTLDDVLCLTVMKAHGEYLLDAGEVAKAREQWLQVFDGDCMKCPYHESCMACLINE